jgi:hypothetical protein
VLLPDLSPYLSPFLCHLEGYYHEATTLEVEVPCGGIFWRRLGGAA